MAKAETMFTPRRAYGKMTYVLVCHSYVTGMWFYHEHRLILFPSMYILLKVMSHKIYYKSYWETDKNQNDKEHENKNLIDKLL